MVTSIERFRKRDDGALLVFFAICAAAIFLIAALSFDLGRRSSTQTDLQSFADNVALAAAGELNGLPGAIIRAQTAASQLISDDFKFGTETDGNTGRTLAGTSDYSIFFYEDLPPDDATPMRTTFVGGSTDPLDPLDPANPDNDLIARFVYVQANEVTVDWSFANILTMFGQTPPDEEVDAGAVAGYTSLACDISPVFFCMPEATAKDGTGENVIWDPENHIGEALVLRTGQQKDSFWESGNFGWLDPRELIPEESLVDPDGDCFGLSGNNLLICLIAAENAVTTCFENGLLTTLPGQKNGIETAVFNTRFDMFNATTSQYADNENFQPGPVLVRGFEANDGDICLGNNVNNIDTIPLPLDDCFSGGTGCVDVGSVTRFGDGDWSTGRLEYMEQNYSVDYLTYGDYSGETFTIASGIDAGTYHYDDPFRPLDPATEPDPLTDDPTPNLPTLNSSASRWDLYVAEAMATYYQGYPGGPVAAFNAYMSNPEAALSDADMTPDPVLPPLMEDVLGNNGDLSLGDSRFDDDRDRRAETGLPQCSTETDSDNFSLDPRRRTVIAAVVDCTTQEVNGKKDDVQATYFIETFITEPVKEVPSDPGKFDMVVEIIGPALNTGASNVSKGVFRNLVQLYR